MKNSQWFKHDSGALADPKIVAMMTKHGFAGYGRYWALVELLREQENYKLDMSQSYCRAALAKRLEMTIEELSEFLNDCIECDLLVCDENSLWSESLLRRMNRLDEIRQMRSEAGKLGGRPRRKQQEKDTAETTEETRETTRKRTPQEELAELLRDKNVLDSNNVARNLCRTLNGATPKMFEYIKFVIEDTDFSKIKNPLALILHYLKDSPQTRAMRSKFEQFQAAKIKVANKRLAGQLEKHLESTEA